MVNVFQPEDISHVYPEMATDEFMMDVLSAWKKILKNLDNINKNWENTIMNYYIEAVCIGEPMGLPEYHDEAEQWLVYFEESETPWSDEPRDVVGVPCETAEEACEIYNHYNINPVMEEKEDEEVAS